MHLVDKDMFVSRNTVGFRSSICGPFDSSHVHQGFKLLTKDLNDQIVSLCIDSHHFVDDCMRIYLATSKGLVISLLISTDPLNIKVRHLGNRNRPISHLAYIPQDSANYFALFGSEGADGEVLQVYNYSFSSIKIK